MPRETLLELLVFHQPWLVGMHHNLFLVDWSLCTCCKALLSTTIWFSSPPCSILSFESLGDASFNKIQKNLCSLLPLKHSYIHFSFLFWEGDSNLVAYVHIEVRSYRRRFEWKNDMQWKYTKAIRRLEKIVVVCILQKSKVFVVIGHKVVCLHNGCDHLSALALDLMAPLLVHTLWVNVQ